MAFEGMDPQTVTQLSTAINTVLSSIQSDIGNINGQLGNVQWVGSDRNHFDSEWQSIQSQLNAAHGSLSSLHSYVTNKVNEQQQASSAG